MPLIAIKDCTDEMLATVKSANDEVGQLILANTKQ